MEKYRNATTPCASPFDSIGRFIFNDDRNDRIIGGFDVEELSDWNFIGNLNGACSATLIAKKWAVTAAHCCQEGILTKSVQFGSAQIFGQG